MKNNYSVQIPLRCLTCGASYAFESDEETNFVICRKCNRVYRGGKDELIHLNEALIEEEKEQLIDEINKDLEKEVQKIFKNIKIKL